MTQPVTIRLGVAGLGRAFSLMLPTFLSDARVSIEAACDRRLGQVVHETQLEGLFGKEFTARQPANDDSRRNLSLYWRARFSFARVQAYIDLRAK